MEEPTSTDEQALKFTVLLGYPEVLPDGTPETYLAHVEAEGPTGAIGMSMVEAAEENRFAFQPNDFEVLAVFAGHHDDIKEME